MLVGESVNADYVIALPKPGDETNWKTEGPQGSVAAIAVLPDGRPVELGTYQEMGAPRCYLRLRDKQGNQVKAMDFVPLLGSAYCRAIDLKIDRDTGRMHVLVERESGDDTVWWAGEISAWGKGLKNIGIGAVGDTALALAARPGRRRGLRHAGGGDDRQARRARGAAAPGRARGGAGVRLPAHPARKHTFTETARDCAFAGDTLVLVGEAHGKHDGDQASPSATAS
jgi:hypothetical protein